MSVGAPPSDPKDLLVTLQRIVSNNERTKSSSWVRPLIFSAITLVGVAVWSWISWRSNRELARLRHERAKAKIDAEQARIDQDAADTNALVDALKKKVAAADEKIRLADADVRAAEDKYEANLRVIDRIRSWRNAGVRSR